MPSDSVMIFVVLLLCCACMVSGMSSLGAAGYFQGWWFRRGTGTGTSTGTGTGTSTGTSTGTRTGTSTGTGTGTGEEIPDWADYEGDIMLFDVKSEQVADRAECKTKCLGNPDCWFIAFSPSTKTCWHKKPNVYDFTRHMFKLNDGTVKLMRGGYHVSNGQFYMLTPDVPVKDTTPQTCAASCAKDPGCIWAYHHTNSKNCWLQKPAANADRQLSFRVKGMGFDP